MQGINYKCSECGYEVSFEWGLSMLSSIEDSNKETRLIADFKNDVETGKYGNYLKQVCSLDEDAYYDISEAIFQCHKCYYLNVERNKSIYFKKDSDIISHKVFIKQQCPKCGSNDYFKAELYPVCPKCKSTLKSVNIWRD